MRHVAHVQRHLREAAQWATFTIADWATEAHALARQHAYTKPNGDPVQDNDFLDAGYFAPAIEDVKLQIKRELESGWRC